MKPTPSKPSSIESPKQGYDPIMLTRNMAQAMMRSQQVAQEYWSQPRSHKMDAPFDPLNVVGAFSKFYTNLLNDPQKLMEQQSKWWQDYLDLCQYASRKLWGDEGAKPIIPHGKDKRFKDEAWEYYAVFDVIRQSYLMASNWVYDLIDQTEDLDPKTMQKVEFYTRQFLDALSPSNFVLTNPEVLKATIENNGENLLKGLEKLENDIKAGKITMTDYSAFKVGENLATTPGFVVFRNELMELIQYTPVTEKVHEVPVLMIPAWINKFYILDLQKKNSYIAWLLEQGYTVFVVSWVNPDAKLAEKNFEDYMRLGILTAMEVIAQRTGVQKMHTVGYCLGGTLLAITLAWLHAKNKAQHVISATYLTTLIDFKQAGDLSVFVDEEQIAHLETRMQEKGYLEGRDMALTFNMLRANDLIWSFVVSNYLLGKEPFPFDLLFWNADSTRMPAKMHSFYMRNMYLKNNLVKKAGITIEGEPIDIRCITTPSFILSTREDHIAPWTSTYAATQLYRGPIEFVLAASGHIAGVINPPVKQKYCYWTTETHPSSEYPAKPESWLEEAKQHEGSWWSHWEQWLRKKSGPLVEARHFTAQEQKTLVPAPGEYVAVQS